MVLLKELAGFIDDYFKTPSFSSDAGINGLQVEGKPEVKSVVLGVDACLELFEKAKEQNADLIFVHHGLFWKGSDSLPVNINAKRTGFLLKNGISLCAMHLPLDAHPKAGNNAVLSKLLKLENPMPFGKYAGHSIGFSGSFKSEKALEEAVAGVREATGASTKTFFFGKAAVKTAAMVSGAPGREIIAEAGNSGIDLLVCGEVGHDDLHFIKEAGINVIAAGHYETEKFGAIEFGKVLKNRYKGLAVNFIDCPTGL